MRTSRLDCCVYNSTHLTRGQANKQNPDLSMKSKNISQRCLILRACTTCPLENARVHPYNDRLLQSYINVWEMEGGQRRKYEHASFLESLLETEDSGVRLSRRITQIIARPRSPVSLFAIRLKARFAPENNKGRRLKKKTRTAHWTTFYEKWKVVNQENTNTSRSLSVFPRRKIQI